MTTDVPGPVVSLARSKKRAVRALQRDDDDAAMKGKVTVEEYTKRLRDLHGKHYGVQDWAEADDSEMVGEPSAKREAIVSVSDTTKNVVRPSMVKEKEHAPMINHGVRIRYNSGSNKGKRIRDIDFQPVGSSTKVSPLMSFVSCATNSVYFSDVCKNLSKSAIGSLKDVAPTHHVGSAKNSKIQSFNPVRALFTNDTTVVISARSMSPSRPVDLYRYDLESESMDLCRNWSESLQKVKTALMTSRRLIGYDDSSSSSASRSFGISCGASLHVFDSRYSRPSFLWHARTSIVSMLSDLECKRAFGAASLIGFVDEGIQLSPSIYLYDVRKPAVALHTISVSSTHQIASAAVVGRSLFIGCHSGIIDVMNFGSDFTMSLGKPYDNLRVPVSGICALSRVGGKQSASADSTCALAFSEFEKRGIRFLDSERHRAYSLLPPNSVTTPTAVMATPDSRQIAIGSITGSITVHGLTYS